MVSAPETPSVIDCELLKKVEAEQDSEHHSWTGEGRRAMGDHLWGKRRRK